MSDIKITIIGRKAGEYHDDEMLAAIWTLLEQSEPQVRRALLHKLLVAAHTNGEMQEAARTAESANHVVGWLTSCMAWEQQYGYLTDAPVRPEPEDEDE